MKSLELLREGKFVDGHGIIQPLTSSIDIEEALYLNELIKKYKPKKTLEIGCAEGISALTICESIGAESIHTIIDPFQTTQWQSKGINNLKKAGLTNFSLIEQRSELALPEMYKNNEKYDFVFVDGWHTFDHVLVEFFYINHLLPVGGIVVFDDSALVGLNRLMRYISNYPNYECIGSAGTLNDTNGRRILNAGKRILNILTTPIGKRLRSEFLNDTVIRSDQSLRIKGTITAFEKKSEDSRGWAWYEVF